MRTLLRILIATLLALPSMAQEVRKFRQWMEGVEVGGMEVRTFRKEPSERIEEREWTRIERLGIAVRQELQQTITRSTGGRVDYAWSLSLASEPMRGAASWSPADPDKLHIAVPGSAISSLEVPAGAVLWPGDSEQRLKEAARTGQPIRLTEFSGATLQWLTLDLRPVGSDPLPGFADAVRFQGGAREGSSQVDLEVWISPQQGEIRHLARMSGLTILLQRAELPPPAPPASVSGFFEQTLARIPSHPFLPWLRSAVFTWEGQGTQELPQDAQQVRIGANTYQVSAPAEPTREEASDPPVKDRPSAEEAPFLATSPLLRFDEPVFNGLLARLRIPPGASRWDITRRVTTFVFEWITEKGLTVGFATSQEVARQSQGDCTEHGVLAVALLRKLGVPARGAVGWAGLDETLGLHFWVEVKLGNRWVPVDPTFDQAPASCVRLKVGVTDLSSLASVGWDSASLRLAGGTWKQTGPWLEAFRIEGDTATLPGVATLRLPGKGWILSDGHLRSLPAPGHAFSAVIRPSAQTFREARLLRGRLAGWWHSRTRTLWIDLGAGKWLQVDRMDEPSAFALLDLLEPSL